MKVLGIYHSVDLDGKCSGAIIKKWADEKGHELVLYGMNHGEPTPWVLINDADLVIISDFSLPPNDMDILAARKELLWYDHHISAIKEISGLYSGLQDVNLAGCELTWNGLFPDTEMPWVVTRLGAYDCWRWTKMDEDDREEILNLQYGMRLDHWEPESCDWSFLLGPADLHQRDKVRRLMDFGRACRRYQTQMMQRICETTSLISWEGNAWLLCNSHQTASNNYDEHLEMLSEAVQVDGVIVFHRDKGKWKYSLRSVSDVDVSVIAKKYGGGGHKGAAGFYTDVLLEVFQ